VHVSKVNIDTGKLSIFSQILVYYNGNKKAGSLLSHMLGTELPRRW
jgi:hypothetical protein